MEEVEQELEQLKTEYDNIQQELFQIRSTDSAHQKEIENLNKVAAENRSCSKHIIKASNEITQALFYWRCGDQITPEMQNLVQSHKSMIVLSRRISNHFSESRHQSSLN